MKGKRGAIELSITTIVVVVIGITLLTLGLVWISGIFDRLRTTTGGAFEKADAQIESILGAGTDISPFTVIPDHVTLKAGDTTRVSAVFSNIFEGDFTGVTVTVNVNRGDVECRRMDSGNYIVTSSNSLKIPIFIKAKASAAVGDAQCTVVVGGNFNNHLSAGTTGPILIDIRK